MVVLAGVAGTLLVALVLWEAFETIVLPRRVTRRFRITRLFYRGSWRPWAAIARRIRTPRRRESFLGLYGPLSLLFLIALWAAGLVFAFALLHWAAGSNLQGASATRDFSGDLYFSGSTFFTLGLGDEAPSSTVGRVLAVIQAGMGFGFLAMVISYLPVLYQSFSRREVTISLLDARAGTPPTGLELLRRHTGQMENLDRIFHEWEHWAAELLESHLSYPVLAYFRSQHDNQSWLAALVAVLDATAMCMVGIEGAPAAQARLTFAMSRHALVDLAQVFKTPPRDMSADRLDGAELQRVRSVLQEAGLVLRNDAGADERLQQLRAMYEPYANALADYMIFTMPPWTRPSTFHDNWKTSRWGGAMM